MSEREPSADAAAVDAAAVDAAAVDAGATEFMRTTMPFAATLRIEALEFGAAAVHLRMAWDERLCTSAGLLHGGVLMALADTCGGACAFANLPEGAGGTATIESKTNFLRGVREGWLTAVSRPLHIGRTTIVVETELHDDAGRLVAKTTQTQAVLPASPAG